MTTTTTTATTMIMIGKNATTTKNSKKKEQISLEQEIKIYVLSLCNRTNTEQQCFHSLFLASIFFHFCHNFVLILLCWIWWQISKVLLSVSSNYTLSPYIFGFHSLLLSPSTSVFLFCWTPFACSS